MQVQVCTSQQKFKIELQAVKNLSFRLMDQKKTSRRRMAKRGGRGGEEVGGRRGNCGGGERGKDSLLARPLVSFHGCAVPGPAQLHLLNK